MGSYAKQRYDPTAIALHWVTAVLIVANLALGLSMIGLPISPRKLQWYTWHKSIGITIFIVSCVRLGWRHLHPPPPAVAMPDWQLRAAGLSHAFLYVLVFAIPLSGWLYSSATGVQVVYLGVVPLPDLLPKHKTVADILKGVHYSLNLLLMAAVIVHVAAALKHHFIDRDETFERMLPRLRPRGNVE
jgi:cytochrome b561